MQNIWILKLFMISISPEVLSVTLRRECFFIWKSQSGEFIRKLGLASNNKNTTLYARNTSEALKAFLDQNIFTGVFSVMTKRYNRSNSHKTLNNLCLFSTDIILDVRKTMYFCSSLTGWRLMHALYFCACAVIYLEQGMFMAVFLLTSRWV